MGVDVSESHLLAFMSSVVSVRDESELITTMKNAGRAMGYDQVLFGIQLDLPGVGALQHVVSGYPPAYQLLYQQRAFIARDPTVTHCQTSTEPLVWTEAIYNAESYELMEEARGHGLGHGISVPLHEGGQVVSMLSLGREKPFESAVERAEVLAAANVLAHCVHAVSSRLIVPDLLVSRRPHLSPREKQCFQLVAAGKSNWDIGCILGVSESAAAFHVKNVLKKMRVSSRMQAVAIGMALGMLH